MKIVHIAPNSPYNDYWGYQDNLLPKYQRKLGHDVTVIITNKMHENGKIVEIPPTSYELDDGVKIVRLRYKQYIHPTVTGVFSNLDVFNLLNKIQPDFIFYHGLVSYTIIGVIKYMKKNPKCRMVEDNHMDYNIGNKTNTLKEKVIRSWLRFLNRKSIKYVTKVYGVTPWRKQYAEDYFKIPTYKTDLLIMGADDEKMHIEKKMDLRKEVRDEYKINPDDFLIVTGGKIDKNKKIDVLMQACKELSNVKLLIFGKVESDVHNKFDELKKSKNIIYIGWIKSDEVYKYFYAADLVFFPGQHSVLWEQACASKVPCVFEKWEGMEHVNNGGNSDFIYPVNVEKAKEKINELMYTDKYYRMKQIAMTEKTDIYLYSKIAEKSLECAD